MKLDKSNVDRLERDIRPPLALAVTIPVDNGVVIYVGVTTFQQHTQPGRWHQRIRQVAEAIQLVADPYEAQAAAAAAKMQDAR